jgi:hypothetical protein
VQDLPGARVGIRQDGAAAHGPLASLICRSLNWALLKLTVPLLNTARSVQLDGQAPA